MTDLVHRFSASFKSVAVNLIRTLFVGDLILERFSCLGYESKYMRNVIIAVVLTVIQRRVLPWMISLIHNKLSALSLFRDLFYLLYGVVNNYLSC